MQSVHLFAPRRDDAAPLRSGERPRRHWSSALRAMLFTVALCFTSLGAHAGPVQGIQPALRNPIVPRGGVAMIPLVARRGGSEWPNTLEVALADGRTITAPIAWVELDPGARRLWTADPGRRRVRPIERGDDTSRPGTGTPYLLIEFPPDAEGPFEVGRARLTPRWLEVPPVVDPWREGPRETTWPLVAADNRPDPVSPFEYWRWVLLAERLNAEPPPPADAGGVGGLVARHFADLWVGGLGRVATESRGVAVSCRDALTRTGTDGTHPIAMWVARSDRISGLLGAIIDPGRDPEKASQASIAWLDSLSPFDFWLEGDAGPQVSLAIINRGYEDAVARFQWIGHPDDLPIAVELPGGELTRVVIDRPDPMDDPLAPIANRAPPPPVLEMTLGTEKRTLRIGPPVIEARPPGVTIGPLRPVLTLAQVQGEPALPLDPTRATVVTIRRLFDQWEVFVECRRPFSEEGGAVTIDLGHLSNPQRIIVPEHDAIQTQGGSGTPMVYRRTYDDRWFARVVLPDRWISLFPNAPTFFGFTRTHPGTTDVETGPGVAVPWAPSPRRVGIDLTTWDIDGSP